MHLLGKARLTFQNSKYWLWRKLNPQSSFGNYYVKIAKDVIRHEGPHKSLGGHLKDGKFGEQGQKEFQKIIRYGITPSDTFVDYGCGTLRVGVHFIKYLEYGRYWGLDISHDFFEEGKRLIGDELLQSKGPNFRTIDEPNVAAVSAAKPRWLLSYRVLTHVHPDELGSYVGNILKIIGQSGTAIVVGKCSLNKTFQFSHQGWAHSLATLCEAVDLLNARLTIDKEKVRPCSVTGRMTKSGVFLITPKVTAADLRKGPRPA